MTAKMALQNEQRHKEIVVWDQHGLVVAWGNGQASRFSWDTLRHFSLCGDCQEQQLHQPPVAPQVPGQSEHTGKEMQ